jgi:hypothetical protein
MTISIDTAGQGPAEKDAARGDVISRGMKSAAALSEGRPHGTRIKYMGGCRCSLCRAANTQYQIGRDKAKKEGDWNGVVSAADARQHIEQLATQNVGRRAISAATDIGQSVLLEIKSGTRPFIRARTSRKILAVTVDCRSDGALVPATRLWKCLNELIAAGYTKTALATELGRKARAIQFRKDWVTVKSEAAVSKLHRRLLGEGGLVASGPSAKRIAALLAEQFRPAVLEARLGFSICLDKRIPARRADAIAELHNELMQ